MTVEKANIFDSRLLLRKTAAWHRFVKEIYDPAEKVSAEQGVIRSGNDFQIVKAPLTARVKDEAGKWIHVKAGDKSALIRMGAGEPEVIGVVHPKFPYFQNLELGRMLNPLSDWMPLESVGTLGKGEHIFFCFNAGEAAIKGIDPVATYFFVNEFRDGSKALTMGWGMVREVCQNTVTLAMNDAIAKVSIIHGHTNFQDDAAFWADVMGKMRKFQAHQIATFDQMADSLIPDDDYVNQVLTAVYPEPTMPAKVKLVNRLESEISIEGGATAMLEKVAPIRQRWEYDRELVLARREMVKAELPVTNAEMPGLENTRWALFNSITKLENYRDGRGFGADEVSKAVVFGNRAATMQRAFTVLSAPEAVSKN
jgi:hypothetical protein